MMSTEENKAIVRRYVEEAVNQGRLGLIEEIFAPNYVCHDHFQGVASKRA